MCVCVCMCVCMRACARVCMLVTQFTQTHTTHTQTHTYVDYIHNKFTLQLIGYNDEILDIALVGNDNSHVAVATNSEQARVFNRHSLNCQLLSGHSGMF